MIAFDPQVDTAAICNRCGVLVATAWASDHEAFHRAVTDLATAAASTNESVSELTRIVAALHQAQRQALAATAAAVGGPEPGFRGPEHDEPI
jgi:hypothetical protein